MRLDGPYFEYEKSIASAGADINGVLKTVAGRYMSANAPKKLVLRAACEDFFLQDFSGFFKFDFDDRYPDAEVGSYAYAAAYVYSDIDRFTFASFRSKTPCTVYLNGEVIFATDTTDEALFGRRRIRIDLNAGRNIFFIKCRKNALGFGCEFGDDWIMTAPMSFFNPVTENFGMCGWAYTGVFGEDIFSSPDTFADMFERKGIWHPEKKKNISFDEVIDKNKGYAYAVSYFENEGYTKEFAFSGETKANAGIYIDGEKVFDGAGKIDFTVKAAHGKHTITAEIEADGGETGFTLVGDGLFAGVEGCEAKWLILGALENRYEELVKKLDFTRVYENKYWKTDLYGISVRLSLESSIFGRWNYPVGVVLYGLNEAGVLTGENNMNDYVKEHMSICTDCVEYAEYDTKKYGRAMLEHQIMGIDALDYCGSCGNAMLDIMDYEGNTKILADIVADYMENKQERLENGMFFRAQPGHIYENSIWADDLYMSVPFLCRYYKCTSEKKYLDDACRQFEGFKEYLYMPDKQIMSHIYNLNYGKKNSIPWGRGNGWVAFALSELLTVLPKDHEKYDFIIGFFREICEGYLRLQDETGLWHQVLDDESTFLESSATSMFVCAFARGVKNGWLNDEKFLIAAEKGWKGLCELCIDVSGNLYAVCIGSSLSFRREYYTEELKWNVNDTHGTGIALLAGVELARMREKLEREETI